MSMRRKLERLEQQARKRTEQRQRRMVRDMSDEELLFLLCTMCDPEDLEYITEPEMLQITENGLRATVIVEPTEQL